MDARTSKRQKKISRKQEQRIAEDIGGRVQPASGAMPWAKSDVRVMGVARAEAKYTAKSSYALQLNDLDKIAREAGLEEAVLQICFVERNSRPVLELAVVPYKTKSVSFVFPSNADLQTFSKRVTLHRDKVALKLLRQGAMYIVFSNSEPGGGTKHTWFEVVQWNDYLTRMKELNSNA